MWIALYIQCCVCLCVCHDLMAAAGAAVQNYKAEGATEPHTKKKHATRSKWPGHTHTQKKGIGHLHFIRKDLCDMRCGGWGPWKNIKRLCALPHRTNSVRFIVIKLAKINLLNKEKTILQILKILITIS